MSKLGFVKHHKFVVISLILHIVALVVMTVNWSLFSKPKTEERIITVELLPVSDFSNVKKQKAQKEKTVKAKKAKKTQKSIKPEKMPEDKPKLEKQKSKPIVPKKAETKPEVKKMEPKKVQKPKSAIAAPKKKDARNPERAKKPGPKVKVKKQDTKKAKPIKTKKALPDKPSQKKAQTSKTVLKQKKKKQDLDALLRTLEQSSEGNNIKSSQYKREQQNDLEHDAFGNLDETMPLSISEKNLIKEQIRRQWNTSMVAGVRNADKVIITLSLNFEIDGEIRSAQIIAMQCPEIDNITCQAVADSAVRATYLASPLEGLPSDRYEVWKEINFAFTPVD